ncbi:hypothetical protein IHE44_0013945 [Lamprotornis superbus]|uniref:Uncharacterized protein n=1 Tax=Lamprotornis superbus TaxID=245042 RepID=A0A835NZJ7_9PASS|nr:hypothetical protein IHE44_0013945 [Lamprotornis superbus]
MCKGYQSSETFVKTCTKLHPGYQLHGCDGVRDQRERVVQSPMLEPACHARGGQVHSSLLSSWGGYPNPARHLSPHPRSATWADLALLPCSGVSRTLETITIHLMLKPLLDITRLLKSRLLWQNIWKMTSRRLKPDVHTATEEEDVPSHIFNLLCVMDI